MLVLGAVVALVAFGCGDDDSSDASAESESDHAEAEFDFGEPADAADATRTVEIVASDSLTFDPDVIDVEVGETVTFEMVNDGKIAHDFTLGDEEMQAEHEAEMREMDESGEMMMHDEGNAIVVEPGETGELTWHFTEPGEVIFGCHQVGHYDAGMYGTITVSA